MLTPNGLLHESILPIPVDAAAPEYIDCSLGERVTIWLMVENAAGVTGGEITLLQAQDAAGLGEKALVMDNVHESKDGGYTFKDMRISVADSKFTTDITDNAALVYSIEIDPADLDNKGRFQFVKPVFGAMTAATPTAIAFAWPKR